jgi:hypothetical protein
MCGPSKTRGRRQEDINIAPDSLEREGERGAEDDLRDEAGEQESLQHCLTLIKVRFLCFVFFFLWVSQNQVDAGQEY